MGVTIHFEGKLKSDFEYKKLMQTAQEFATANQMEHNFFENKKKVLLRVKNNEDWDYSGATKGIRIQPSELTDPLILEFDKDNYLQEYCKTQFAEPETHIQIIEFLKTIQDCFDVLAVNDEGEYWQTADRQVLVNHINTCFHQIETLRQNDHALDGPFKTEDNRIVDLMRTN